MMTMSKKGPEGMSRDARSAPAADSVQATTSACLTTAWRTSLFACNTVSLPLLTCHAQQSITSCS